MNCATKPWNAAQQYKKWSSMEMTMSVQNAGTSGTSPAQSLSGTDENRITLSAVNRPVLCIRVQINNSSHFAYQFL
jgi:hypothetical protein